MTENARRQPGNCGLMEHSSDRSQEGKKLMDSLLVKMLPRLGRCVSDKCWLPATSKRDFNCPLKVISSAILVRRILSRRLHRWNKKKTRKPKMQMTYMALTRGHIDPLDEGLRLTALSLHVVGLIIVTLFSWPKSDDLILLIDFSSQQRCVMTDWERGRGEVAPRVIYVAVHH